MRHAFLFKTTTDHPTFDDLQVEAIRETVESLGIAQILQIVDIDEEDTGETIAVTFQLESEGTTDRDTHSV